MLHWILISFVIVSSSFVFVLIFRWSRTANHRSASTGNGGNILAKKDFNEVWAACESVSHKWMDLGTRLGVYKHKLDQIEANREKVEGRMRDMLTVWLERPHEQVHDNVQPTWRGLCEALWFVDKELAIKLRNEHGFPAPSISVGQISESAPPPSVFLPKKCGCGKCTVSDWRTALCKTHCNSDYPKLLVVDPNHSDATHFKQSYGSQASLYKATKELIQCFEDLTVITWKAMFDAFESNELNIINVSRQFRCWLNPIQMPLIFPDLDTLQCHLHTLHISWYKFRLLHNLVTHFLEADKYPKVFNDWNEYLKKFEEYCKARNLEQYKDVFFKVEDHNVFLLEVDECFDDFTLIDIEGFIDSLSHALRVPSVCLHLVTVREGSLIIYLYYCFSDYLDILDLSKKQLKAISNLNGHKILSLTDLHDQFRYENIQKYCDDDNESIIDASDEPDWSCGKDLGSSDDEAETERIKMLEKMVTNKSNELFDKNEELKKIEAEIGLLTQEVNAKDKKISILEAEKTRCAQDPNFLKNRELQTRMSETKEALEEKKKSLLSVQKI